MKYLWRFSFVMLILISLAFGNLLPNGGLEGGIPSYFHTGGTSGTAQMVWATDEWRTGGRSLKIEKPNADGTAYWESDDLYRYWSVYVSPNVSMEVGAWVKTVGVNTSPGSDDEKIQVIYNFYSSDGVNLLGGPLVLDVPQDVASSDGWVEVKSSEPLAFPVTVDSITVRFQFGSGATGVAYVEDFFIRNTVEGEWVGDFFNPNVDVPEGWFYWWMNFPQGLAEWDSDIPVFAGVTDEVSHSGEYSLKIVEDDDENDEVVVNTDPVSFENDGNPLVFSVWMKAELPEGMSDSANTNNSYGVGFTVTWHDGSCGADGWGEVGGTDYRFILPSDTTDWIQYTVVMTPPENATQFSLRARYWNFFKGTTYWDDFEASKMILTAIDEGGEPSISIADGYKLLKAFPNPFNPTTTIQFAVPHSGKVRVVIYDFMGKKVKELVNRDLVKGNYLVNWDATDEHGRKVSTGVYFVVLESRDFRSTYKITLLK